MLVSITGTGNVTGDRASGPTAREISRALHRCGAAVARSGSGSATQMLLADLAAHFSSIRLLDTTEIDGNWHSDAIVEVQSRGNAPVNLKIQFHLQQQDASWVVNAARLLQG